MPPQPPRPSPSLLPLAPASEVWPLRARTASPATLVAVALGALVAAVGLPVDRPGLGWLPAGLAAAAALTVAARPPSGAVPGGGEVPGRVAPRRVPAVVDSVGWGTLGVALLAVGTFRAADWLFALCALGAALAGVLAVTRPRTAVGVTLAGLTTPVALGRALPWTARSVSAAMAGGQRRRVEAALPAGAVGVLFGLFVALQAAVLSGGRGYVLRTANLTFSQYARRGFWQLLLVSLLALGVLAVLARWAPRARPADRALLRTMHGNRSPGGERARGRADGGRRATVVVERCHGETCPVVDPRGTRPSPAAGRGPARVRVVLADLGRLRPAARSRAELAEQSQIGEALVRGLVRAKLALALRLAAVVGIGLGGLPLLFAVAPGVATARPMGVALPWLLLGVAAYPFLFAVGAAFVRLTERIEADFADLIEHPGSDHDDPEGS